MKHLQRHHKLFFIMMMIFALPVMLALSASTPLPVKRGSIQSVPVEDNKHVYKGALVVINDSGYAEPAADATAKSFIGIAYEECDNTIAGHTQGGLSVRVERTGTFLLVATGMAQTSVGKGCFVTDDSAVALTSTYGVKVGTVVEYVSSTSVWVEIGGPAVLMSGIYNPYLGMVTKTDNYTVLVADSGKNLAIATDGKAFTLPAWQAGLQYTFVNTAADGAITLLIQVTGTDGISGGGLATSAGSKGIVNTKATSKYGDNVTIVSGLAAGVEAWLIVTKQGIWAAQA